MPAAVLFGGPSPEHDVSILTGLQALRALSQHGEPPTGIYWDKSAGFWEVEAGLEAAAFLEGPPKGSTPLRLSAGADGGFVTAKAGRLGKERRLEISGVINCCHGGPGEDGTLQGALDAAGVSYSGPSVTSAALAMDKLAFGAVVSSVGLPSLPRWLVSPSAPTPDTEGPFIVKPRFGGSSIGIAVVNSWADAVALVGSGGAHWRRGAVAEPYLESAYDLNISVRTYPSVQLSLIEKPLRDKAGGDIYSYREKYLGGEGMVSAPRELPAVLAADLDKGVKDAATAVASAAQVRGVPRIDFLVDGDRWWVNEINPIPGSLARYLWVGDASVEFSVLLQDMLAEATKVRSAVWDSTGADGLALRSASTIASKLG